MVAANVTEPHAVKSLFDPSASALGFAMHFFFTSQFGGGFRGQQDTQAYDAEASMNDFLTPKNLTMSPVSIADSLGDEIGEESASSSAQLGAVAANQGTDVYEPPAATEEPAPVTPEVTQPTPAAATHTAGVPLLTSDGFLAGYSIQQSLGDRAAIYDQQDRAHRVLGI